MQYGKYHNTFRVYILDICTKLYILTVKYIYMYTKRTKHGFSSLFPCRVDAGHLKFKSEKKLEKIVIEIILIEHFVLSILKYQTIEL